MTADEHCKLLGRLVGNLQSLEFILRGFLQELPSARPIGIPPGTDLYAFPVGHVLPESEMTSWDTLSVLIEKFNREMRKRGAPGVDARIVEVRDALAHGRVSSSSPDENLRLLKFSKPSRRRVRIVFNEQMTKAWFEDQMRRARQAIIVVHKAMVE